jgi:N4-gp56 family major capsid protein
MAATEYAVNDPLAVKLWGRKLMREALKKTWIYRFIGNDDNSVIQLKTETQKSAGDKITYGLRMQLNGDGIQGDGTLEGNEEALTTYSDSILVDQLRHAVRSSGRMSEQRVPFSVREEARAGLQDWWAARIDTWFFNQVCGNAAQSDTRYTGNNAVTISDSSHTVRPSSSGTDEDMSDTASQIFSLSLIDNAVEKASTASPMVRPLRIGGSDYYVLFLHDFQVTDLRTNTDTGQWLDIQKSVIQGGNISNNPVFTGALGVYNGVILHKSNRITTGVNSSTSAALTSIRRAVLCGAQATALAYGVDHGPMRMEWVEELFDYGNQLGVSAGCISGMKKTRFNSLDYATVVIPTFALAHG